MLNLVLKDIIIQKKTLLVAIFYVLFFSIALQSAGEIMYPAIVIAVSYVLVMGAFTYDDKNKADTMLNSLPLKRGHVVSAKYISLFLYLAGGTGAYIIISGILSFLGLPLKTYPVTPEGITGAVSGAVILYSIHFPLVFKIGYTKAKVINMALFFASFFGVPLLVKLIRENIDSKFIKNITDFVNERPDIAIGPLVLLIVFTIFVISYSLSVRFYKNRDF